MHLHSDTKCRSSIFVKEEDTDILLYVLVGGKT
jgi:hypothetical protein